MLQKGHRSIGSKRVHRRKRKGKKKLLKAGGIVKFANKIKSESQKVVEEEFPNFQVTAVKELNSYFDGDTACAPGPW